MTTAEYNNCVDLYSDGVYRFILKNTKDIDKAKDVVQETFVRLWNKVEEVDYVLESLPSVVERLRALSPLYQSE